MDDLSSLYEKHFTILTNFLTRKTQNRDLAEDIVQTVFTNIISRKSKWTDYNTKNYLVQACYNEMRKYVRMYDRLQNSCDVYELEISVENTILDDIFRQEQLEMITKAISQLPKKQQNYVIKYFAGFTIKEIADFYDLSYDGVKASLRIVFAKLRASTLLDGALGAEDLREKHLNTSDKSLSF